MKRARDLTAWRNSTTGTASYHVARAEAQKKANDLGLDVGLEANDLFHSWTHFLLPAAQYRNGHELRCEVVRPETIRCDCDRSGIGGSHEDHCARVVA